MRKVVMNTKPLIALADIGQLELLHQLYYQVDLYIEAMK